MEKVAITANQKDLMNLVKLVTEENKVYELEGEQASAVLISQANYDSLQETVGFWVEGKFTKISGTNHEK